MTETERRDRPSGRRKRSPWRWLGIGLMHFTGLSLVSSVLGVVVLSPRAIGMLWTRLQEAPALREAIGPECLAHLALSALVWGAIWAVGMKLRRRETPRVRLLRAARGTALTETLIILPVLLMLIFGLSQFAVNNLAAILARLAAYEGARAAWIWVPEANAGRRGVDRDQAADRVRITIAMAMTPVAPGDFTLGRDAGITTVSREFSELRQGMFERFRDITGAAGWATADVALTRGRNVEAVGANKTYYNALDASSFSTRAVRKMTHAYFVTDLGSGYSRGSGQLGVIDGAQVGVRFRYWHQQAFPLVSNLFGERRTRFGQGFGGRRDFYDPIDAEFTFPRQRPAANANWPRR